MPEITIRAFFCILLFSGVACESSTIYVVEGELPVALEISGQQVWLLTERTNRTEMDKSELRLYRSTLAGIADMTVSERWPNPRRKHLEDDLESGFLAAGMGFSDPDSAPESWIMWSGWDDSYDLHTSIVQLESAGRQKKYSIPQAFYERVLHHAPRLSVQHPRKGVTWLSFEESRLPFWPPGEHQLPLFEIGSGGVNVLQDQVLWSECRDGECRTARLGVESLNYFATPATATFLRPITSMASVPIPYISSQPFAYSSCRHERGETRLLMPTFYLDWMTSSTAPTVQPLSPAVFNQNAKAGYLLCPHEPSNAEVLFFDEARRLWMINLVTGSRRALEGDFGEVPALADDHEDWSYFDPRLLGYVIQSATLPDGSSLLALAVLKGERQVSSCMEYMWIFDSCRVDRYAVRLIRVTPDGTVTRLRDL